MGGLSLKKNHSNVNVCSLDDPETAGWVQLVTHPEINSTQSEEEIAVSGGQGSWITPSRELSCPIQSVQRQTWSRQPKVEGFIGRAGPLRYKPNIVTPHITNAPHYKPKCQPQTFSFLLHNTSQCGTSDSCTVNLFGARGITARGSAKYEESLEQGKVMGAVRIRSARGRSGFYTTRTQIPYALGTRPLQAILPAG